ncbi:MULTISPECIES: glycosyltransferase family 2 protein [Prevotellaceae]|uniref:glycosyltransferase family 2 protein n=1 Tax=Prevotellaceae TaxID=171552 RepID=UPI0003D34279|nr:glycosyltransferase family 2 protein [Prevotella phocaeensis]ETD21591.1 hypothetical protein HMPREF1199_00666 [Hoylesella oralis CC98A]
MTVSIIVPIYKAEKYLHKCVNGLLAQTYKDYEIILVDDGSPDCSGNICDSYATNFSQVKSIHKMNGGLVSARLYGFNYAKGKYIIQIDPDDWVEPNMLEEMVNVANREKADMVICDFYEHCGNNVVYSSQQPKSLRHDDLLLEMFETIKGTYWNKLIRRDCYTQYLLYEDMPNNLILCEDLYVMIKLLINNIKITYLPHAYYHYERDVNVNSITRDNNSKNGYNAWIMNMEFRKLLSPYREYWSVYVVKEMPWIAYLSLYYGVISGKEYSESFYELKDMEVINYNGYLIKLALVFYPLAEVLVRLRKIVGRFKKIKQK